MGRPPGAPISSKRRSASSDSPAAERALMAAVYLIGVRLRVGVRGRGRVGVRVGVRIRAWVRVGVRIRAWVRVGVSDGCGVQPRVPRHAALVHLVQEIAHLRSVAKGGR